MGYAQCVSVPQTVVYELGFVTVPQEGRWSLASWRTLMTLALSPNGEESLNTFLSPDQDQA